MGFLTLFLNSSSNKLSRHTRPRGAGLVGIANNKLGFELVNSPNVDHIHVWSNLISRFPLYNLAFPTNSTINLLLVAVTNY